MNRRRFLSQTAAASLAGATFLSNPHESMARRSDPPKVRVGVIGTSHAHGPAKTATVRELADSFDLVGVVEPSASRRHVCQSLPEFANVRWLNEDELFATADLQAVIIETDFADLLPAATRGVAHGFHVHLDKPPGKSVDALAELLTAASQRNVHVQMGYMLRYNPAFELCFRAAREGWLGRIFELNATMSTVRPAVRRKELGEPRGGAMFDLGCHLIDSAVTVLGPPHNVTPFGRSLYSQQDNVVDNQLAVLEYADAIATVRATFVEPHAGDRRQFVVCGEHGTLEIRPLEPPSVQLTLL